MGIDLYLLISKSVTLEEWEDVYDETLQLVQAFPLAELQQVTVRGIPGTRCVVRTHQREASLGEYTKKTVLCWHANSDYTYLRMTEDFTLRRDLSEWYSFEPYKPDVMINDNMAYILDDEEDQEFAECYQPYRIWFGKTQWGPNHLYLLAIACLITTRLGRKAYVYGNITQEQCERAVEMANEHLERPIHIPDQCDLDRLCERVKRLPLTEVSKIQVFEEVYNGPKNNAFVLHLHELSEEGLEEYCKRRLQESEIGTRDFDRALGYSLRRGLDLKKLCSFVRFEDPDGGDHHAEFVRLLMDYKLHHPDKLSSEVLGISPDDERLQGLDPLARQFHLMSASDRVIKRYIPIEEMRSALSEAIGDACPTNEIIDEYLAEERSRAESDVHEVSYDEIVPAGDTYQEANAPKVTYDIEYACDLPWFKAGDTIHPSIAQAVGESFAFYAEILEDNCEYQGLMELAPRGRCCWLAMESQHLSLRDTDWERIYDDVLNHPESFRRYYPMCCVKLDHYDLLDMARALAINDDLYAYAAELARDMEA